MDDTGKNIRKKAKKKPKIPNLPYGEGSMIWDEKREKVVYAKSVNGKRVRVYADTPKQAMDKMREQEGKLEEKKKWRESGTITFGEAIMDWHKNFKVPGLSIRSSSYDREYNTIKNQIMKYPIAQMQMQAVDERDLQRHIKTLIDKPYAYSTVKKTYEVMDQFYKYYFAKAPYDNPMNLVKKPTQSAMNVQEKEIEYFDEEDLEKFMKESLRTTANDFPVYPSGRLLIFLCYTGMRVNEMLALRWKNVDLERASVLVRETHAKIIDWERSTEKRKRYKDVYTNTKKNEVHKIFMTKTALKMIKEIYDATPYKEAENFVASTKNGSAVQERNLRRCLNSIQEKAEMKIQNSGLHVLRHTFCSLMCREGVDEGVVASLLGQKDREMVKRVYRHISEHEQINAVRKVDEATKNILGEI